MKKFTINTAKLQEMVSRAVKGASNNKLIPLTSLMLVELKNNVLTLVTTDATNYLYIREEKVDGEDFYVTVQVDVFSKLIARMTSDNVTLNFHPDVSTLEVVGNGNYKIELPLDEDGQLITYPDPAGEFKGTENTTINRSTIQVILETIKSALATTLENPCYTGYYVGDSVVATDTYKIADMDVKLFDTPKLISPEMMNLLSVMSVEKISVTYTDQTIMYSTPDCVVYGPVMEGIDDFTIEPIKGLVDSEFESVCKIPKTVILQLLDRLSLFVGTYDKNGIYLTFTKDGLQVSSKDKASSVETISYISSEDFKNFICCVDIQMLVQEIKAINSDAIELWYGADNAIKITDGNITIIIALLEDETEE